LSGLAVIFNRKGAPAETGVLAPVMERLQHRGPDGCAVSQAGSLAIGHCHFWTTPEEVGETQPLRLAGLPFVLAFDGRLDNRVDLLGALGLQDSHTRLLSDAALVLRAYRRWGEGAFARFIGPFALVLWDDQCEALFLARDALGDRTLFYCMDPQKLVAASEAWAVAGYPGLQAGLDEVALAHHFAFEVAPDGRSLFSGVYELLPAHVMKIERQGFRAWRFWQPNIPERHAYKSDLDYAEEYRSVLAESVRCRLRSTTPAGIVMSGGLDSTSLAAVAATLVAPRPLTTISYVFDELPDCDERHFIEQMQSRFALHSLLFNGDDAWPMRDWAAWTWNPETSTVNPYNLLKEGVYKQARQAGMNVLLDGEFGDNLYGRADDWLADLLVDGQIWEAGREIFRQAGCFGLAATLKAGFFRRLGRRGLNRLAGKGQFFSPQRITHQPWLTPYAISCLEKNAASQAANPSKNGYEPNLILGLPAARGFSRDSSFTNRFGIEMRRPFRDRRLIEFILALPAYQLHSHCWPRYILRNAMLDLLPQEISLRQGKTSFVPLLSRGFDRERHTVDTYLKDEHAIWRKFIRPEWLSPFWEQTVHNQPGDIKSLVLWYCVSTSAWVDHHRQGHRR
jgi:asparagine synthase (glutamine-hydrolysing)